MEEIRKIPPVTRFLLFATGLVTLPCILQIIPVTHFVLFWPFVTSKWHFWRLITAFFYGGSGLPLLFDLFLLYRNSSELELNTFFRRTSEYAWALILIGATIIGINYPLRSAILFNPMLNALTYLWARANPNAKVSFFGMITVPAPYLPYAYLALDLIRGGPPLAIQSATGLVSAHCYYFLKDVLPAASGGGSGSGSRPRPFLSTLVQPPIFLQKLLPDSQDPALEGQRPLTGNGGTSRTTGFGTAYAPAGRSFGDNGASNLRGGNTLGSSSSGGGSWIPSFFRGGNNNHNSSSSNSNNDGLNRNALLEATERRLREQRNNSIAGRNQNSYLNKSSSSNSSTTVPTSLAGSTSLLSSDSKTSSITSRQGGMVGNEPTRRTNPSTSASGQGGMLTFGQFAKKNDDKRKGKEEDHSSSGGSVAEQRRGNPSGDDEEGKGKGKEKESIGYQWGGGGNRLGD